MRKNIFLIIALAVILILGSAAAVWQNHFAFAKNQATSADAKKRMVKYSAPHKKKSDEPIRKSRLEQMNIVGEAAAVLNMLPITIINEMKKGKKLVEIAKEKGLTEKEFTQKISDFETKTVNTAVKKGTIPKEHADAIKAGRSDRLKKGIQEKAMNVNDHMPMDMGN